MAHLRGCFSNPHRPVETLIRSVLRGTAGRRVRLQGTRDHDERGLVAKYSRGPQTGYSPLSVESLLVGVLRRRRTQCSLWLRPCNHFVLRVWNLASGRRRPAHLIPQVLAPEACVTGSVFARVR